MDSMHRPIDGPEHAVRYCGIVLFLWKRWAEQVHMAEEETKQLLNIEVGLEDGELLNINLLDATNKALLAYETFVTEGMNPEGISKN